VLPLSEVQTALYEALTSALAPVPVYDHVSVDQVYPYVTIGESIAGHSDTLGEQSIDIEITVHVWSRQSGFQECQQIMTQAKDALDRETFAVPEFQWVTTIWTYSQTLREPDGETRHGILRFQILTFQS
jgi:Protein of unknown function (DUF3168)